MTNIDGLSMGEHTFNYRVCYSDDPDEEGAEFGNTVSVKFDVPPQLGDVNADKNIDSKDVAEMANYIMGKPSSKFKIEVADMNNDKIINVADLILIINLIP